MQEALWIAVLLLCNINFASGTPVSSPNWVEEISTDGIKFTGRNGEQDLLHMNDMNDID